MIILVSTTDLIRDYLCLLIHNSNFEERNDNSFQLTILVPSRATSEFSEENARDLRNNLLKQGFQFSYLYINTLIFVE